MGAYADAGTNDLMLVANHLVGGEHCGEFRALRKDSQPLACLEARVHQSIIPGSLCMY